MVVTAMKVSALRRVTLIVVSLMVSGCAVLRPPADAMDYAAVPSPNSMATSSFARLNSDLPFARNFDMALRQAQDLRKKGKLDEASRVLAQLVLASPDDPRVVGEYGKVMLESGYTGDAVAFLERAITLQPSDWTLHSALGVAYDQGGKRDSARASFHRALALKPGDPTVLSNLAVSHMQAGELDEAERLLLQASERGKDIPGIAAKLAMVQNIRTTTAQSRPMAVSTLPQPLASPGDLGTQIQPPAVPALTSAPIEAAPAPTNERYTPESIEDEHQPTPEDDVETEDVAVTAPPATIAAPSTFDVAYTTNKNKELKINSKVVSERIASTVKSPAKKPSIVAVHTSSKARQVRILSVKSNVETKEISATAEAPEKAIAGLKPAPVKVSPSSVAVAPRLSVSLRAEPSRAPATVASPPAAQVASAAPPAAASPANPTPQAAIMTRRADVSTAVSRTAPVPLVLAAARDSWESMVRVSLPPATDAGPKPVARADQSNPSEPSAKPATWSVLVKGWVRAALGSISAFWA